MNKSNTRYSYLSYEEKLFIKEELLKQENMWAICLKLKRSHSTITQEVNRHGGIHNYDPLLSKRKLGTGIPVTCQDKLMIKSLIDQGLNASSIATKMNRSHNTIRGEINRNGGIKNYNPKIVDLSPVRATQLAFPLFDSKENERIQTLENKIASIEMQLDILIDKIREIQ